MANKPTSSATETDRSKERAMSHTSESGRFVVVKPATASKRFTAGEIRKAVRSVAAASKGARRK